MTPSETVVRPGTSPRSTAALRRQYGFGPAQFAGSADALYDRHLFFDHVIDPAAAGPRERYEAVARSVRDILCAQERVVHDQHHEPVTAPLALNVIGVSHTIASVKVREALVLTPSETAAWLEGQRAAGRSTAILSTCNRFEIYWSGGDDLEPWFREFARKRGVELGPMLVRLDGQAAVRYLFCVASGLDSQILGETEIRGQVRRAHHATRAAGASSRELDAVFQGAIEAGRRVRHETGLGRQAASVSSAAVDIALATTTRRNCATALVLGAGEVADGVIRALVQQGVERVTLVNRRPERAAALAAKWGAEARSWAEINSLLASADLIFVATGAKHPLLRGEDLAAAAAERGSDLVVLDLAVPRNVAPAARGLPGIRLFDLDQLQDLRCPTAGQPTIALAEAHRIVDEELERLKTNLRARAAAPQLAELHRLGLVLAQEEAERALAHLGRLSQAERQIVRDGATRLVRRVLYSVSRRLKEDMRLGGYNYNCVPPSVISA